MKMKIFQVLVLNMTSCDNQNNISDLGALRIWTVRLQYSIISKLHIEWILSFILCYLKKSFCFFLNFIQYWYLLNSMNLEIVFGTSKMEK